MTKPEYLKLKPQHSQHRRIVCVACALLDHALAQTKQFFSKTGYIFSISQQKKGLSTCFSSHCSGQSGWNLRLPQSDKDFCNNVNGRNFQKKRMRTFYLILTVHPNGFSFDTSSSLKRVWRSKKSRVSRMDFVKGIAQNRSPVLVRKGLSFGWTLSKWLKPQKKNFFQSKHRPFCDNCRIKLIRVGKEGSPDLVTSLFI